MNMLFEYIHYIDYSALILICTSIVVICGLVIVSKKKNGPVEPVPVFALSKNFPANQNGLELAGWLNLSALTIDDTKQRRGSKANHGSLPKSHNNKKDNDAVASTSQNATKSNAKQSRSRRNKQQNDRHCYDSEFSVLGTEDNKMAYRGNSKVTGDSSSNEETYTMVQKNTYTKKGTKSLRHKNRKQHVPSSSSQSNLATNFQQLDVKPDLRKKCTKAAALKTAMNHKPTLGFVANAPVINLPANMIYYVPLTAASSTTSFSSSASSSTDSSPTASPSAPKRLSECLNQSFAKPLKQFAKLNMSEMEMVKHIKCYLINEEDLKVYGFPVESVTDLSCVEIYKCLPKHLAEEAVSKDNKRHHCHYYGRKKKDDALYTSSSSQPWKTLISFDSGRESDSSSLRLTDSDSSDMSEPERIGSPVTAFFTPDGVMQVFEEYNDCLEKQCVRCAKVFQVNAKGEYLTFDSCKYHWGKLSNVYNGKGYINTFSCCQGEEKSEGCSYNPLHVWNGVVVGINGPYDDYVQTQYKPSSSHLHPNVYALDCEMSYTGLGLEVTKVTVVGFDGRLVYEHFVIPQAPIVDYNTRFSGVSEKDLIENSNNSVKTFAEVQNDLLDLFDADTILIGHGMDNDLRCLRLVHKTIVDTSLIFTHSTGFPYRRSLKNLTKSYLKRDIQCGDMGHSSYEDALACLELVMWKIRKDRVQCYYQ